MEMTADGKLTGTPEEFAAYMATMTAATPAPEPEPKPVSVLDLPEVPGRHVDPYSMDGYRTALADPVLADDLHAITDDADSSPDFMAEYVDSLTTRQAEAYRALGAYRTSTHVLAKRLGIRQEAASQRVLTLVKLGVAERVAHGAYRAITA